MIELISHCYAALLPQYALHLRYQISSLALYDHQVPFRLTVCACEEDRATKRVLRDFTDQEFLRVHWMEPAALFRRSIGRNEVAMQSEADLIWFTDVDHVFASGCLDHVWQAWQQVEPEVKLIFPLYIMRSKVCDSISPPPRGQRFVEVNFQQDFHRMRYVRAIGGVQITCGEFCRQYGYLNESKKWQQPRQDNRPFADFREDPAFRYYIRNRGGEIQRMELLGIYRIRHTEQTHK